MFLKSNKLKDVCSREGCPSEASSKDPNRKCANHPTTNIRLTCPICEDTIGVNHDCPGPKCLEEDCNSRATAGNRCAFHQQYQFRTHQEDQTRSFLQQYMKQQPIQVSLVQDDRIACGVDGCQSLRPKGKPCCDACVCQVTGCSQPKDVFSASENRNCRARKTSHSHKRLSYIRRGFC